MKSGYLRSWNYLARVELLSVICEMPTKWAIVMVKRVFDLKRQLIVLAAQPFSPPSSR